MKKPVLILLSGLPASGKSTVGDRLSADLSVPMYTRDMFKEMMFDAFDWQDGGWTKDPEFFDKIGFVANSVLFKIISREMKAGRPVMIENAFHPHIYGKILNGMREKTDFLTLQINFTVKGEVLSHRIDERQNSGEKHPGHGKAGAYKYRELIEKGGIEPLDLPGKVIRVDTTDWRQVNFQDIETEVSDYLKKGGATS